MLDGEELALLALGYHKCFLAAIYCPAHGGFRWAAEAIFGARAECPICHCVCDCTPISCVAFTRHPLPLWEQVERPLSPRTRERLAMNSELWADA